MRTRRFAGPQRSSLLFALVVSLVSAVFAAPDFVVLRAQKLAPIVYTVSFLSPASKTFNVEMIVPADGRASVDLLMPVWSPGFYGLQNYADRLTMFMARAEDGAVLDVQKPKPSRWTIATCCVSTVKNEPKKITSAKITITPKNISPAPSIDFVSSRA